MADKLKTPLNTSPCTIGELTLDLLLQEEEKLSNKVTQFPVENGSPASDHVINDSALLTITGFVTNAPIRSHPGTGDNKARVTLQGQDQLVGDDINFVELAIAYLRKIRLEKAPVTVITRRGTYENMLIQDFTRSKDKTTGDALVFTIQLIEFRQVKLLYVAAPKRTKSGRAQPRTQIGKKAPATAVNDYYGSIGYKLVHGFKDVITKAPE